MTTYIGQPRPRCPIQECDKPLHAGLHEDAEGFRWRQDVPDDEQWAADEQAERAWREGLL